MKHSIVLQIILCTGIAATIAPTLFGEVSLKAYDPNLVGWWKFDEGAGTAAYDSADSKNGTVNGATWTTGQIGGALSFDGINDYAGLPNNTPVWLPQNDFSLSSWVYFDTEPASRSHDFILDLDFTYYGIHEACTGVALFRNGTDGKAIFQIETTNTTDSLYSNEVLAKGRWYHVVAVRQGTTQRIYLDGNLSASRSCSGDPIKYSGNCNDDKVNIGRASELCWANMPYYLDGKIDNVRIYNRALSDEEVEQLYDEGFPEMITFEIIGPDETAEQFTASYKAVASYENGTTKDVTTSAVWFVGPDTIAAIDAGQLTTGMLLYPEQIVTLYAQYTENETLVSAEKPVSILAICPTGTALKFDGINDYAEMANTVKNSLNTDYTVSAWIKTDTLSGNHIIAAFRDSVPQAQQPPLLFQLDQANADIRFIVANNAHTMVTATSSNVLTPGKWCHAAGVREGNTLKVYVNGISGPPASGSLAGPINSDNLKIGALLCCGGPVHHFFNGFIDDVRIYNRALSEEEIGTIMFSRPDAQEPGLVAYWDFDDANGQTAADASGHGNDGILGGNSAPDIADPCWVESDAPLGRCTTEEIIVRDILNATENKAIARQSISDAIAAEQASLVLIEQLRRQTKGTQQQDLLNAKAKIQIAVTQERVVSLQIDATIRRLEEALRLLGYETDNNSVTP